MLTVVKNDKIKGSESGLMREIDVSIRGEVVGTDILYITQAKNHARPADVNVIGAFSAVIKDVGASKGFLICAAGFTATTRDYARNLGIELLTLEDINSRRWKAVIEIPVALIKYDIGFNFHYSFTGTRELNEAVGGRALALTQEDVLTSLDYGKTFGHLDEQIRTYMNSQDIDLKIAHEIAIPDDCVRLKILGCLLSASDAKLRLTPRPKRYMKYVKPEEFLVIKDHLRDLQIPINLKVSLGSLIVDESWYAIPDDSLPVRPAGISIDCEINPDGLNEVHTESIVITPYE